jgi:hypothetical protein
MHFCIFCRLCSRSKLLRRQHSALAQVILWTCCNLSSSQRSCSLRLWQRHTFPDGRRHMQKCLFRLALASLVADIRLLGT